MFIKVKIMGFQMKKCVKKYLHTCRHFSNEGFIIQVIIAQGAQTGFGTLGSRGL